MNKNSYIADYLKAGLALVPIPLGSKGPRQQGWNNRANVITTAEAAVQITGNVGLAHAYCTPCPTAALDIDNHQLAFDWFAEHSINLDTLINASNAVLIQSGRPNRAKIIFTLPNGIGPIPTVQVLDPHSKAVIFELRCTSQNGKTVQDVLPPSIHPDTGNPYTWAGNGHFSKPPTLPDDVLAMWQNIIEQRNSKPKTVCRTANNGKSGDSRTAHPQTELETPRRVATVREQLSYISADCDYPLYRDIVWAVTDTGWSCTWDLLKEWSEDAPHRFNGETLEALIDGFDKDGGIHLGTLIHHARKGGWHG
jgi:putative DNA primase/helicase